MDDASTRGEAYAMVAAEFGRTVGAIKMMASREGLTSWSHSLHFSFSEKDERDLVAICKKYARQGSPLLPSVFKQVQRFSKKSQIFKAFCVRFL